MHLQLRSPSVLHHLVFVPRHLVSPGVTWAPGSDTEKTLIRIRVLPRCADSMMAPDIVETRLQINSAKLKGCIFDQNLYWLNTFPIYFSLYPYSFKGICVLLVFTISLVLFSNMDYVPNLCVFLVQRPGNSSPGHSNFSVHVTKVSATSNFNKYCQGPILNSYIIYPYL